MFVRLKSHSLNWANATIKLTKNTSSHALCVNGVYLYAFPRPAILLRPSESTPRLLLLQHL